MASPATEDLARRCTAFYDEKLRTDLENTHRGAFVTIVAERGAYFTGRTLEEAIAAACRAHPGEPSFTLRVGHAATVTIGALS